MKKRDLKVTDMIVVAEMDKQTGLYQNILVTNRPRWKKDIAQIFDENTLLCIEIFPIGVCSSSELIYHSMEDFENEINL